MMTLVTRLSVRWFRIIESELNDEKQENIGNRSIISFSSLMRKGEKKGEKSRKSCLENFSFRNQALLDCNTSPTGLHLLKLRKCRGMLLTLLCSIIDHDQRCWSSPQVLCLDNLTSDEAFSRETCSKRDVISKGNREIQSLIMNDQFRIRKSNYRPYQSEKTLELHSQSSLKIKIRAFSPRLTLIMSRSRVAESFTSPPIGHPCRTVIDVIDLLSARIRRASVQWSKSLAAQSRFGSIDHRHSLIRMTRRGAIASLPSHWLTMIHGTSDEIVWTRPCPLSQRIRCSKSNF